MDNLPDVLKLVLAYGCMFGLGIICCMGFHFKQLFTREWPGMDEANKIFKDFLEKMGSSSKGPESDIFEMKAVLMFQTTVLLNMLEALESIEAEIKGKGGI